MSPGHGPLAMGFNAPSRQASTSTELTLGEVAVEDRGQGEGHSETQPMRGEPWAAVPYGGDAAVARSIAAVHVRNPWTGRCRACLEVYPCPDRQDADAVLGPQPRPQRLVGLVVVLALVAVVTGVILALVVAQW